MRTSLWMLGAHGEHSTPTKRLSTRSMKLDKISHMCSSLDLRPDYKNHSKWTLNRIRHEKHPVSPQRSRNQLTQGSIRMRCHRDPMSPESTTSHSRRISQGTAHSRSQLHPSTFLQVPQYHMENTTESHEIPLLHCILVSFSFFSRVFRPGPFRGYLNPHASSMVPPSCGFQGSTIRFRAVVAIEADQSAFPSVHEGCAHNDVRNEF